MGKKKKTPGLSSYEKQLHDACREMAAHMLGNATLLLEGVQEAKSYWRRPHKNWYYWAAQEETIKSILQSCENELYRQMVDRFGGDLKLKLIAEKIREGIKEHNDI